jgi:hypothetical protein
VLEVGLGWREGGGRGVGRNNIVRSVKGNHWSMVQLWATCWVYVEEYPQTSCRGTYTRWKSCDIEEQIAALITARAEHTLL